MDRREHQVAGQRRLNGDLRRFHVADFSDHDLVRIVTQNRAQSSRERQPFLLVDRNLRDAADLIFDRIFDGDDLVFLVLDLHDRAVERRGLAASGRVRSPEPFRTAR